MSLLIIMLDLEKLISENKKDYIKKAISLAQNEDKIIKN